MIARKFIDILKALSLNLAVGVTEMCFLHIFLYAHSLHNLQIKLGFFAFVFFFLDVDIRFISQCELTNSWFSNKTQWSDILYERHDILVTTWVSVLPW